MRKFNEHIEKFTATKKMSKETTGAQKYTIIGGPLQDFGRF